ncbi:2-succinyl-5-enolpyruvyl-6-hydroxy-3-cyclohexene-1-carboxylic-acid synthase [Blattabacterium cuenoti]|uniref:2-succinyl-5-enolpyruvyl-6-hydroxy-3- cyclohexene-1-carboxylic-acid synthase n=1 Tax=Blattabacterium cuenoti TaxID=1653831 RepID=UPI00163C29CD|nr:2-succinyl-5-enolpyruvyl-6-hydroxy-3-cyclohexene-1-carboxylic-acid synthase [Blattabacterium cuenoti]
MYSTKKVVQSLGEILKKKSIFHIIISPGSRNAPIIIHFTEEKDFTIYSIVDERCAAFFALGIAQQITKPVVVNCTSGSAVVNYYPAITEAFYQRIPLIILTADRPKEIIDIFDGQSIYQKNIFQKHVISSVQLTEDESNQGLWYNEKLMNESINECIIHNKPIHINIPFSEPLYETTNDIQVKPKIIKVISVKSHIEKNNSYKKEKYLWKNNEKKMILLGLNYPNSVIKNQLQKLNLDPSVVITSEISSCDHLFFNIDYVLIGQTNKEWNIHLKPHILITIGTNIISKKIKYLIRKYPPIHHWHVGEHYSKYPDTYYQLSTYWPIDPNAFLDIFCNINTNYLHSNYKKIWNQLQNINTKKQVKFFKKKYIFSDLKALFLIFSKIPNHSILQLGNSMIIRYYQFLNKKNDSIKTYCNRGTSGIDGCISTAIGASLVRKNIVTLIIGDISFFYDSNALWNNYTPTNFRIILMNNGGGDIFKFITEKKFSQKTTDCFQTKHFFTAKKICEMYKWKYKMISNQNRLNEVLNNFWNESSYPSLLEINTKNYNNISILKKYISYLSLRKKDPKIP